MINYILISILIVITVFVLLMLIYAVKEKQKLIREREAGKIDQYILLTKFENTIKRITELKENDPAFSEEIKKIYFEEINDFIERANIYIDGRIIPHDRQLLSYKQFCEIIYAALFFLKKSEKIENRKYYTAPEKYILEFKNNKIAFDLSKFEKTIFSPQKNN